MWDLIIISPFFRNLNLVCLFIYIQSLRIEFEVGINTTTPTKGATYGSCVIHLDFRPDDWKACNSPVHNGDRVIFAGRRHEDWLGSDVTESVLLECMERERAMALMQYCEVFC